MIASYSIIMLLDRLPSSIFLHVLLVVNRQRLKAAISFHDRDFPLRVIDEWEPSVQNPPAVLQREVVIIDEMECATIFVCFNLAQRCATFLVRALRCCWQVTPPTRCPDRASSCFCEHFIALKIRLELRPSRKRQ